MTRRGVDTVREFDLIEGPIGEAYAAYDSDPRANGPDGFEAFADAVSGLFDFLIQDWTRATWDHTLEDRSLDVEGWLNAIRDTTP